MIKLSTYLQPMESYSYLEYLPMKSKDCFHLPVDSSSTVDSYTHLKRALDCNSALDIYSYDAAVVRKGSKHAGVVITLNR